MDTLPPELLRHVMSNLNLRDVARAGGASRALRDASHTEFHNLLATPVLTQIAGRYKSKLQTPFVEEPGEVPVRVRERIREARGEGGGFLTRPDGSFTSSARRLKRDIDRRITNQLGRPIDRGRA